MTAFNCKRYLQMQTDRYGYEYFLNCLSKHTHLIENNCCIKCNFILKINFKFDEILKNLTKSFFLNKNKFKAHILDIHKQPTMKFCIGKLFKICVLEVVSFINNL